ncbi:MAG: ABC transporter substrate-binding protein [Dethiobacter sp.]|jgi:TRAP-type C4-dicarboxylate transport system substrate-binding protein|nr:MAG: ABC transporter substrate-binding protein [Dethiobacter sp.]
MKIKVLVFLLVLALVALPLLGGCAKAPAPAAPTPTDQPKEEPKDDRTWNLQFATFWPATDFQVAEGHMGWAKEIEKRTNGRVTFTFHPANALLGANEIFTGVADGAADLGTTCPAYTPGLFPVTEAFELPGYKNDNALVASMTMWEAYKTMDLLQKEYKDVKVLMFWATGPGDVMTNKPPVRKLEDLKGLQIRTVGGTVPSMKALEATPVSMPMSDAYLALDSGLLAGILAPTDTLKGFKLAEVINYVTKTPFLYNIVFMKVMNWDTWNSFPADIQKAFTDVSEEYVEKYGKLRTDHTEGGLQYGIKEHKVEVITLSAEEQARWLKQIEPVVDAWIEKTNKAGLPGNDVVKKVKEIDAKMSQKYGSYGK